MNIKGLDLDFINFINYYYTEYLSGRLPGTFGDNSIKNIELKANINEGPILKYDRVKSWEFFENALGALAVKNLEFITPISKEEKLAEVIKQLENAYVKEIVNNFIKNAPAIQAKRQSNIEPVKIVNIKNIYNGEYSVEYKIPFTKFIRISDEKEIVFDA